MLYLCKESLGRILFSDKLTEKFFEDLSVVKDGLLKNTERIFFKRVTTENLLVLKYFLVYNNEESKNYPKGKTICSVNEALEEFSKGKHLYAVGNYFSEAVRDLGHHSWSNPIASGRDPYFREKDAEIIGFIRNPKKLEVYLKCTCEGEFTTIEKIHKFTIVQAHF